MGESTSTSALAPQADALLAAIRQAAKAQPQAMFLHRLHCVRCARAGCATSEVARAFGHAPKTIRRWLLRYQADGLAGLEESAERGRPSKLSARDQQRVQLSLRHLPSELGYAQDEWTGALLQDHIQRYFGIELSVRQCQRLLKAQAPQR